jgi:polysaccharide export outer membrane protein
LASLQEKRKGEIDMKSRVQSCYRILLNGILLVFLFVGAARSAGAQPQPPTSTLPTNNDGSVQTRIEDRPLSRATIDTRYRIGPGDVLEVRVLRAPELSRDGVRVDQRGMIRMPMWNEDIQAACKTEAELAGNIGLLYLKYKRDPHVDVFVKEFHSRPVAVTGAVRGPAQFKLQRPVRLLELLSFAGGTSDNAGQTVQVIHAGGALSCEESTGPVVADSEVSSFVTYKLSETLHGVPEANPLILPGDLVSVPSAAEVYVVGNVLRPLAIPIKEPITVSRAVAIAGGTAPSTKRDKVRIIRQVPGGTNKQEIYVNLGAIEKNKADDVLLLANDIVDVPSSGAKTILRSLIGTIAPAISQLPVRVIP